MTIDLFDPTFALQLGPYSIISGAAFTAYSDQNTYFDWAKVTFAPAYSGKINLDKKQPAEIYMGYGTATEKVFEGFVAEPYNAAAGQNQVMLKDSMLLLEATTITDTFLDVRPREIIEVILQKAGVTRYQLATADMPAKPIVPIRQQNGIAAIRKVGQLWGLDYKFYFLGGTFYWGCAAPQRQIYQFTHGQNILHLQRSGGLWELETVSVPFIHHSQLISVQAPAISGTFEVCKTCFKTDDSGFVRALLYFGGDA